MDVSDCELLERWAQGDARAGHELIERHIAAVRGFFRNGVSSDREDLIQQTFLACLEARTRYRGDSNLRTFILAIARNQLFKHYRQIAQRKRFDSGAHALLDRPHSQSEIVARRQQQQALSNAVRSVPLDMQIALELAYGEGLDAPQIAELLGVPINTVYSRLRRARELLRQRLS